MKLLRNITLLMCLALSLSHCNSKKNQNKETETIVYKSDVIKLIQKEYPDIDEKDLCIDSSSHFKEFYITGFFAHDKGCSFNYAYFKGEKMEDLKSGAKEVLLFNGFEKNKEELALQYHIDILNASYSVLRTVPEPFSSGTKFFKPMVETVDDQIICTSWISKGAGMVCAYNYAITETIFTTSGDFVSHNQRNKISIPCK